MHWASHKHTAAEVIFQRADAEKENIGLTSWQGKEIRRTDVEIEKVKLPISRRWRKHTESMKSTSKGERTAYLWWSSILSKVLRLWSNLSRRANSGKLYTFSMFCGMLKVV